LTSTPTPTLQRPAKLTSPGRLARSDCPAEALAREFGLPPDEIRQLYEHTRAELASGAHVPHYVPIFAVRKLRELLSRRCGDSS
jgi:hypothetical protein